MSDQFELDFDAEVKEADDIEIVEYNFSPTTLDNGVIDYSAVENDKVFLVNKKDILTLPKPDWIPEFDIVFLTENSFLPPTIKSSDGFYYVISDKNQIYKMSANVLASTIDYNIKKSKIIYKVNNIQGTVSLPRKSKSMSKTRYKQMVELLKFVPEYKDDKSLFVEYSRRNKSKEFLKQNNIIFNQYRDLLGVIKGKILDLNIEKLEYISSYSKGQITSYGDTGLSNALYNKYGVKIKKQNGSTFTSMQKERIEIALDNVFDYFGDLSNLAKDFGLKISYADNCRQHARKACGVFSSYHNCIGVSFFDGNDDEKITMAHEISHWLDKTKGKEYSYKYASDKEGTIENKIAEKYKKLIREQIENNNSKIGNSKKKLGNYWYRTCECFARAMEQDFELTTVGKNERCHPPVYLPEEIFNKEINPLIEELKKENEIKLNLKQTKDEYKEKYKVIFNTIYNRVNLFTKDMSLFEVFKKHDWKRNNKEEYFYPLTRDAAENALMFLNELQKEYKIKISNINNINLPNYRKELDSSQKKLIVQSIASLNNPLKSFTDLSAMLEEDVTLEKYNTTLGNIQFRRGSIRKGGAIHLIDHRYRERVLNKKSLQDSVDAQKEITAILFLALESLDKGNAEKLNDGNYAIKSFGCFVYIGKDKDGQYVVTGFTNDDFQNETNQEAQVAISTVIAQYGYTPEFLGLYAQVGAIIASFNKNISYSQILSSTKNINNNSMEQEQLKENTMKQTKNFKEDAIENETKPYSFFVRDTAEFEMYEEFETITGLTAKEAISEYKKLREDGLAAGIGINIPSDITFNDPKGLGTTILVRKNGIDTFDIYGDSFIVDLKENNERSQNRIAAYKELYEELQRAGLNVKEPKFVFDKHLELNNYNDFAEISIYRNKIFQINWLVKTLNISSETADVLYENYTVYDTVGKNYPDWNYEKNTITIFEERNNKLDYYEVSPLEICEIALKHAKNKEEIEIIKTVMSIQNSLEKGNELGLLNEKSLLNEYSSELIERMNNNSNKFLFIFEKLQAAGIEVVTDKEEFNRILEREELLQKMAKSNSEKYLNTDDVKLLNAMGYKKDDFEQIQYAMLVSDIKLNGKKTSTKKTVEILGREDFLSGIARSAFHGSSERINGDNSVSFESYILFERVFSRLSIEKRNQLNDAQQKAKEHVESLNEIVRQESYFSFDVEDEKKFINHIDDWQKDNTNPLKMIIVGKVPPVMKVLGISEKLIEIEQSTLDKMLRDEPIYPNDKQGHKLSLDDIYAIPSQLADPVMVFKSRSRNDSYVFFTERKDLENRSILIPLAVDKKKGRLVIHEITSMYGRNNEVDFVKTNIDENNLIYEDRKRSCLWANEKVEELKKISSNGERFTQIQFLGQRFTDNETYIFNILTKERLVNFLNGINGKNTQNFITQDGRTYGFTHEGKIYLNPEILSSEAALHEYTHLWDNYTKVTNPELWNKGKEVFKNTYLWEEVKNDEHYQDISHDEDLILSECHARITGKIADQILDKILTENGKLAKDSVIDWDKEVFEYISKEFTGKDIDIQSVSEFVSQTMKDFMEGRVMQTLDSTMEQQTYKYYTKRPVDIGTVPKGFASFENFDSYEYNEDAGRQVFGFVEYDRELSEKEIKEFELFKPNPYREFRIEPTKENGLKEPYILIGRQGFLQGTPLSNHKAYIQDASKVDNFDFLVSIEETIQFIENGFKRPKETSLTINIKDYEIVKTDNKTEELSSKDIKLINNFKKETNLNLLNDPTSVELVTDEMKSDEVAIIFNYDIDKEKLYDLFVIDENNNKHLSDKDNNVKLSFKVSSGSIMDIDIQCYKENKIYNLSFWSDVTDTAKKELCNLLKEPFKSINNNIDFTQKGWNDEWHKNFETQNKSIDTEVKPTFYLYNITKDKIVHDITEEDLNELKEHLSQNGYSVNWNENSEQSISGISFSADYDEYPYIQTILEDRAIDYEYKLGLLSTGYDAAWLPFEEQLDAEIVTEEEFKRINELREKEFTDLHLPYVKIYFTESDTVNHKPAKIKKGTVLGFTEGIELIDELNKKFNTFLKSDISFYMWDEKQNDYVEYNPGFEFHDNIRTLDNGKEIPYTQTPITEEIRMICSYPEVLDLFEETWIKQFAPTITDEQKNFIKELTDASYTKLNEHYNQEKETLSSIYDEHKKVHSSFIINADVADTVEQSLENQQLAIARLFNKTLEYFATKITFYLDENKELSNQEEFLEYAKHKIFNVLQDVQFQESRNAKYGENGWDFDFGLWRKTNEKIIVAGDYNTEFNRILSIKENSLQQTEEYAKEIKENIMPEKEKTLSESGIFVQQNSSAGMLSKYIGSDEYTVIDKFRNYAAEKIEGNPEDKTYFSQMWKLGLSFCKENNMPLPTIPDEVKKEIGSNVIESLFGKITIIDNPPENNINEIPEMPLVNLGKASNKKRKEELPFTIIYNKEKGRVNIKFEQSIPTSKFNNIIKELKEAGWGYSKFNKQWYPFGNSVNNSEQFAKSLQEKYSKEEEIIKISFPEVSFDEFTTTIENKKTDNNSIYEGIKFFDRNYQEIDEFVAYFNKNLDMFNSDVVPIDEKDAQIIFEALNIQRFGLPDSRQVRLGLDKENDNLILLNKKKQDVETKKIKLPDLLKLAFDTIQQDIRDADKIVKNLENNNIKFLGTLFESMQENIQNVYTQMTKICDTYLSKPLQEKTINNKKSKILPLEKGDKIGDETVIDVYPIAKGINQATLSQKISIGGFTARDCMVIDNSILENINPEITKFLYNRGEKSIIDTSDRILPHLMKELIDKNYCPPRDSSYYERLENYVKENPLKYEQFYPITKESFKSSLKELIALNGGSSPDILWESKKLLNLASSTEKKKISNWLLELGCSDDKSMENLFNKWIEEKSIDKDISKKNGYPPRGEK